MRQLKRAIRERQLLLAEDRAALAVSTTAARHALLARLGKPPAVAAGFGGGLLLGYLRCRCERVPAEAEQAAPSTPGGGLGGLVSWVLRHFGWAIATAVMEHHQAQNEPPHEPPL